jgi:tripartite-type tricarboxylate transporter receptor subunit TctC
MTDLIGGQIDLMCDQTTNTSSQIEGKKIKAFGVTTLKRLTVPALKDMPTLDESGLKGFEVTIWHGLYAPKGTPADVAAKINTALKAALKDPTSSRSKRAWVPSSSRTSAWSRRSTRSSWPPRLPSGARSSRPRVSTPTDARYQLGSGRRSARTGGFFSRTRGVA